MLCKVFIGSKRVLINWQSVGSCKNSHENGLKPDILVWGFCSTSYKLPDLYFYVSVSWSVKCG